MKKIQDMHNKIFYMIKENVDLKKYVTNVYNYSPKQVTIPYLKVNIKNYKILHMLSNFAIKVKFSCDIYTYHRDSMFNIIKHIHLILNEAKYSNNKNEFVVENDCIMNQFDEVLHSTINFDVLIKEIDNE